MTARTLDEIPETPDELTLRRLLALLTTSSGGEQHEPKSA